MVRKGQTWIESGLNGLSSVAKWTSNMWQRMPDSVQYRLEGGGQALLGGVTTARGVGETMLAGGSCIASVGLTCATVPIAASDIVGGVTDMGKGLYGAAMGTKTTEGYYPVEELVKSTAGNGKTGKTLLIALSIDPKGLWRSIKNGFGAVLEYGTKNAAQNLPPLQGKNLGEINQTLTDAGFSLRNPGNIRNQNRCHPDGSICRVNPIGHPPKTTDPHLHKEFLNDNTEVIYDDYGNQLPDKYRPEAHITINP